MIDLAASEQVKLCNSLPEPNTGFCIGIESSSNTTSRAQDLAIRIEAWLAVDEGYVVVGIGSEMANALIFIVYADQTTPGLFKITAT